MSSLRPTAINANRQKFEFSVSWNDGHISIYPFALLRSACPCVECRGGHDKMSSTHSTKVFDQLFDDTPATRIKSIESVGTYAITIEWEDGHHYGIYSWDFLRGFCPCPICQPGAEPY